MFLRINNPREQNCGEHRVRLKLVARAGQKFFQFVENQILIADERKMILSGSSTYFAPEFSLRRSALPLPSGIDLPFDG